MRVRIVRQPSGSVDGISVSAYRAGRVYDVDTSVGSYLIAEGFAQPEMRRASCAASSSRERRRAVRAIVDESRENRRSRSLH
jgi:hypothetical protein